MAAIEAKIVYETGKTKTKDISILMEQYQIEKKSNYSDNLQRKTIIQQKDPDELKIEFYILTYTAASLNESGEIIPKKIEDARERVDEIKKLLKDISELHRQPVCRVEWGEEMFCGILSNLDYRYTMFMSDGIPVRVSFKALFTEYVDTDSAMQNDNTPQSPDRSKYRPIFEKTQLYQMAYIEYDDPGKWRIIAEANEIDDPLDLIPGTMLSLPPDN